MSTVPGQQADGPRPGSSATKFRPSSTDLSPLGDHAACEHATLGGAVDLAPGPVEEAEPQQQLLLSLQSPPDQAGGPQGQECRRSGRPRKLLRETLSDAVAAEPLELLDSPPNPTKHSTSKRRRRKKQRASLAVDPEGQAGEGPPPRKAPAKEARPRWYNQTYIVYLVLRQASRPLNRAELIPAVLEMEKHISAQRGLPKLFHGRTPQNTCSAILTTNNNKLFVRLKLPGDPRDYFSLAYTPGNFDSALELYDHWTATLIEKDWPIFFGPPPTDDAVEGGEGTSPGAPMDKGRVELGSTTTDAPIPEATVSLDSAPPFRGAASVDASAPAGVSPPPSGVGPDVLVAETWESTTPLQAPAAATTTPAVLEKTYDIPTALDQVVEVRESTIPGAGRGLFAVRDIPKWTYLGFYFGVPMTEDEFDSLKQYVGLADAYSHRYRNTILDATDEQGQPYTHHPRLFCPFHFMNEDRARRNVAFVEGHVVNQVLCMTTRLLRKGQELFVDYGKEVDREGWRAKPLPVAGPPVVPPLEEDGAGEEVPPLPPAPPEEAGRAAVAAAEVVEEA